MRKNKQKKINILMCCSDLSVKGGMVSVLKNYLEYDNWQNVNIIFIPTHIEKSSIIKVIIFLKAIIKITYLSMLKKIDIAHLHVSERGSVYRKLIISKICKINNIKVILHHHGAEFEDFYSKLNDKEKKKINLLLMEVDLNIVLSKRLISMIKQKAPNSKVEVLYNAVNTYKNNPYNLNSKDILFLGRIGKRKGTYDLIEAIKVIDSKIDKDIKFYLCGDGDIDKINKFIDKLNINHRIAHVGWIDKEKKKEIFKSIAINVLPSYNEGLPMTILETMAYGIPNIASDVASIPEIINENETGRLVKPGDIDKLSKDILDILTDINLRRNISSNSYRVITDKFSIDKNINKLKEIYLDLLIY